MSFEATKARLIDEFVETQAAIRAQFNMKTAEAPAKDAPAKPSEGSRPSPFRSAG